MIDEGFAHFVAHFEVLARDRRAQPGTRVRRPGTPMASTVRSSTPAASPRQPACAAATREPSRMVNNTGRQSATMTTQAAPVREVTAASAVAASCRRVHHPDRETSVPCTWFSQAGSASNFNSSRSRARSPRHAPRRHRHESPTLNESQGAALTPPSRVVNAARTPARQIPIELQQRRDFIAVSAASRESASSKADRSPAAALR